MIEFLPEALITTDTEGNLIHVNSIAKRWHEVDPSTIPGSEWPDWFWLLDRVTGSRLALDQTPVARVLKGETPGDQEMVMRAKGQPLRTVARSGDFPYDLDGQRNRRRQGQPFPVYPAAG